MNSKSTKAKRKAIPTISLADLDKRDGVERFDHLMDPLDKWLQQEKAKDDARTAMDETERLNRDYMARSAKVGGTETANCK